MSCDASSRPPSTEAAALAAAAAAAASLAPGFRFHPTDEELVSYYLKRKVLARPFLVDAISEVDLYKLEPWDLPVLSRIQSRDTEWYFFSPLDKKYSNRSRTNRATGQGYWKTTGKDRSVRRGSGIVGMKKTLVFHVGRAPRGERTNWVMHEYRLEDEELIRAGVPQDAYVVCRIFQKNGPGPQNGAHYGAPLVEEEWEDDVKMLVPNEESAELPLLHSTYQRCIQFDDPEQESKVMAIQNENGTLLPVPNDGQNHGEHVVAVSSEQNILDHPADPSNFPLEACQSQGCIDVPELHDDQNVTVMAGNYSVPELHQSQDVPKNDYLELSDLANPLDVDNSSFWDPINCLNGIRNDKMSTNLLGQSSNFPELHGVEAFFDATDGNAEISEPLQRPTAFDEQIYLEAGDMLNPLACYYPSGEQIDDGMVYFDAPSHNEAGEPSFFIEMNDLLNRVMFESTAPDSVDELMAYFDAPENISEHSNIENSEKLPSAALEQTHLVSEANEGVVENNNQVSPHASDASCGVAPSSSKAPLIDLSKGKNNGNPVAPGIQSENNWEKTITGRLVGMLGSIPSPPTFAAEHPLKSFKSLELDTAAQSSSSIHISAGMIHIHDLTVSGTVKHWSLQKSDDVEFLLSYGMAMSDVGLNLGKVQGGGTLSLLVRSGFCLFSLSIMFLAISFKMGVYIYAR